jgi:hypothetical protein
VARIGAPCRGLFWPILVSGARCRSSVVEHSIGNGEVHSSTLCGSTIFYWLFRALVIFSTLASHTATPGGSEEIGSVRRLAHVDLISFSMR